MNRVLWSIIINNFIIALLLLSMAQIFICFCKNKFKINFAIPYGLHFLLYSCIKGNKFLCLFKVISTPSLFMIASLIQVFHCSEAKVSPL